MVQIKEFGKTPMGLALKDLAGRLEAEHVSEVELNVIGGFALMLRGYREISDVTDIDYVGKDLPGLLDKLSREVGLRHKMEPGWINNEGMLTGDSMEDFELSTGKLHFEKAFSIGPVTINVLDEKDLLRLKVIAIDTAMTEMEVTGDFARRKDFTDIKKLGDAIGLTGEQISEEFEDYILCGKDTKDLLKTICDSSLDDALRQIDAKSNRMKREGTAGPWKSSPYLESMMDGLMRKSKLELTESDLKFSEDVMESGSSLK